MSVSLPEAPPSPLSDERADLRRVWWAFLVLGLVSVLVGLLAISSAFVATMASVVVFGVLLLVEGVSEVVHAVMVRNWRGFALHLLAATLYLLVGLFLLEDPVRAAAVVTLLISASFFVGGLLRIVFSLAVRFPAWGWVLLTGAVDLILGIFLWTHWPEASLWLIGLLVGIDLLFHGWSWLFLALSVRAWPTAQNTGQTA
jgi:uncharacterized membrane protein HdeD (DUF308 family)